MKEVVAVRRLGILVAVLALALVGGVLPALPAGATPPEEVFIESDVTFADPSFGTFTATGPICESGTTLDPVVLGVGFQSGQRGQLLVVKEFTCDDGSGTFTMLLRVTLRFVPTFSDTFTWSVISGTGAYENLHGTGEGFGVPTDTGVFDTYAGRMHFD